ncbi:helix-turn-helix transcriptional regulator [Leptolyngbya sp. O-77]|uniref:helix-turn-helix transcriptional regulator n=1 Tax=Leptolyngbya sp. O-77 TaxID=1080068 RepID=UPI00074D4228|nr:AraC family transcriptional regulator [Leptolyngbya sp. O-77]BAU40255.1 Regulatory protein PchR [Leptolyngbya sp. O-77]
MTLIFNESNWDELEQQAPVPCPAHLVLDDFEELTGVPTCLGRGYSRGMALVPGVWLNFNDKEYYQDFVVKTPAHEHPIQIEVFLSGYFDCNIYPRFGGTRSYFSGSGISPGYAESYQVGQRFTCINVEIKPEVLDSFLMGNCQQSSHQVRQLFKGEDWKVAFYPSVTPEIRAIAQQMWDAPYRGELKRLYLQAKVLELLVIYLDLIADSSEQPRVPGLKPETIDRLHQAKEILTRQLAHPPSLSELAQQVGVSDRTLQRGFREVFNTTVFGYLHTLRMEQAEWLLRNRQMRVSEVAHAVGYSHLGHFTEAFKRRFGITPKQCQKGEKGTVMAWMQGMHSS